MSLLGFNQQRLAFALVLSFVGLGCDANPNGYQIPRGNGFERANRCSSQSTGWIRHALVAEGETEEARLVTELLILGQAVSADDETGYGCLYWAQLDYEGSIVLDQGQFRLDWATFPPSGASEFDDPPAEGEPYRGVWTMDLRYDFIRQPEHRFLSRHGVKRSAYPLDGFTLEQLPSLPRVPLDETPRQEREIEFHRDGNRLSFTVDGETKWFKELGPTLDTLDPEDPEDLEYLARVANLGLLISQVRVIGFGSSGITNYRTPKHFLGLMEGSLNVGISVSLEFEVDGSLDYREFSDIPGLSLDGAQLFQLSSEGTGTMDGVQGLELSMDAKSGPFASPEFDYSDVVIEQGYADSGTVAVSFDAEAYEVDVEDAFVVDFRGLIPLE